MTLPSSGALSLNQIHIEAGGSSSTSASLNDADIRGLIGKGDQAVNSFNDYFGASSSQPTATFIKRLQTTSDGFPSGSATLSSGSKLVVVCMTLGGITSTTPNSYVSCGGVNMTLAARLRQPHPSVFTNLHFDVAIYYLVTSASGSTSFAGNGGSGRSTISVFEVSGYDSSTPYTTDTAYNTASDNTLGITVDGEYNGLTMGAAMSIDGTGGGTPITITNTDFLQQDNLQSATAHCSFYDTATPSGNRTYTYTNTTDTQAQPITIVTASWK
jgi:hypothetical protein